MTNAAIISLIIFYSNIYGIDPKVAIAVARYESSLNPNAIGKLGELGIFQLRPEFIPKYSKKELLNPAINIVIGIQRLKQIKETCVHKNGIDWLVCYNYGESNAKRVKYPSLFPYVKNVKKIMEAYNG
jgi:soluble lytic murein transglycosylase-like protein